MTSRANIHSFLLLEWLQKPDSVHLLVLVRQRESDPVQTRAWLLRLLHARLVHHLPEPRGPVQLGLAARLLRLRRLLPGLDTVRLGLLLRVGTGRREVLGAGTGAVGRVVMGAGRLLAFHPALAVITFPQASVLVEFSRSRPAMLSYELLLSLGEG